MKKYRMIFSLITLTFLISFMGLGKTLKNEYYDFKPLIINQTELTGTWYWESSNNTNNIELYLVQSGNSVFGKHCGSFYDGSKLDCVSEDDEYSISLTEVSENVFEGTLRSAFSDNIVISIRITLSPENETIYFQRISQPIGEYYLPNNVTMALLNN